MNQPAVSTNPQTAAASQAGEGAVAPRVSVIVPAYNEASHLRECLASLCAQDYPRFKVLLVDNASTDETRGVCAQFPAVKYLYYDQTKSSYGARNFGAAAAGGEVLCFFDADQTALPGFLKGLLVEYVPQDPRHIYVGRLTDDPRMPRVLREFFTWGDGAPDAATGHIATAAVAIPRALFEELGGFKPEILTGGDREFFTRAVQKAAVHRPAEMAVYHYWARTLREHYLREERYGFGRAMRIARQGSRRRSLRYGARRLAGIGALKMTEACAVPFCQSPRRWRLCWHAQWVGFWSAWRRFRGHWLFYSGRQRAGDLPADASISNSVSETKS